MFSRLHLQLEVVERVSEVAGDLVRHVVALQVRHSLLDLGDQLIQNGGRNLLTFVLAEENILIEDIDEELDLDLLVHALAGDLQRLLQALTDTLAVAQLRKRI